MVTRENATRTLVLLNAAPASFLQPLTVQHTLGASDYALLEYFPSGHTRASELEDAAFSTFDNALCEIYLTHPDSSLYRRIHYGRIVSQQVAFDARGEHIQYLSRLDNYMVSQQRPYYPVTGGLVPGIGGILGLYDFAVMNPIVDGVVIPNYDKHQAGFTDPDSLYQYWKQDPLVKSRVDYWTLPLAVHYLCTLLAGAGDLAMPTLPELQKVLPADAGLVRDFAVPPGKHLFELLADLLHPLGYSWYVDYGTGPGKPKLTFLNRVLGAGGPYELKLQKYGAQLNIDESNTEQLSLKFDIVDLSCSHVIVYGDYPEVEYTFTLVPGWLDTYDSMDAYSLHVDSTDWTADPQIRRVWRTWVLNEGGDYIGYRPSIRRSVGLPTKKDGSSLTSFIRRRRFLPTISVDPNTGEPIGEFDGVNVQWRKKDATGAWEEWQEWQTLGEDIRVLERECGIEITDPTRPSRLKEMVNSNPANVEIRVTATIRGDERMKAFAGVTIMATKKPNVFHIHAGDKFRSRYINSGSRYFGERYKDTAEIDDQARLQAYADEVVRNWQRASCTGTATLFGMNRPEQLLGRPVTKITPRNFDLNIAPPANLLQYPVVSAVTYDINGQATVLTLDTFFAAG